MTIIKIIRQLVLFGRIEREAFVTLFSRDQHGEVVRKRTFPISYIANGFDGEVEIYIEEWHERKEP